MESAQTNAVVNAIKKPAKEGGMHVPRLTVGRHATTSTLSPKSFCLDSMRNKMEDVQFAAENQKRLGVCTWTIATKLEQFGVCCATAATQGLGRLEMTPSLSKKHSVI